MQTDQVNLYIYPNQILKTKCEEVTEINSDIELLITQMFNVMRRLKGIGISAPQIGSNKRICIVEPNPSISYVLINPVIIEASGIKEGDEGCLSFPNIRVNIKRPTHIKVEALDVNGELKTYEVDNEVARIFCHEIDHIEGILMIDYLSNLKKDVVKRKMNKLERRFKERYLKK